MGAKEEEGTREGNKNVCSFIAEVFGNIFLLTFFRIFLILDPN